MGIENADGRTLGDHWSDGPQTYLGLMTHGFPNLFFPGGPHGASGNNPRYGALQVDFVQHLLNTARKRNSTRIEVPPQAERAWMDAMARLEAYSPFEKRGQYYGANTPGKKQAYLLNPGGRPTLDKFMAAAAETGYRGFLSGDIQ